ncbi:PreATP-grasp domain-containing protein, partial [Glonium stellatum]
MDTRKVGVLGGGQLGRMLIEAANRLNIQVNVLDAPAAPAKQISAHDGHVSGSFKDAEAIRQLAKTCDVLTVEIEHVDTAVLAEIEQAGTVAIEPRASTLRIIKDKFAQKQHLAAHGVAVAESVDVEAYINGSNPNPNSNSNSSNSNNDSPSTDPSSSSSRTTALTTALTAIGRQLSYPYMLKSKTDAYDGRGN